MDQIKVHAAGSNGDIGKQEEAFLRKFLHKLREVGDEVLDSVITSNNFLSGDMIKLDNIHTELGYSDAFVFMPNDGIDQALKLASAFVGVQTGDDNMFLDPPENKSRRQKPVVVINHDGKWDKFLKVIQDTRYIGDAHKRFIVHEVKKERWDAEDIARDVVDGIGFYSTTAGAQPKPRLPKSEEEAVHMKMGTGVYKPDLEEPDYKVCVFCSASRDFKKDGKEGDENSVAYQVGKKLVEAGYGVVSGAGREHMMGDVVRGAVEAGGWTAGSNTPTIRALEGLPDGLAAYVDTPDIYKRMRVMIEGSSAFVIAPGGMGSIQEFLTLLHLKEHEANLMEGKPIVILNPELPDSPGKHYWDALIDYAKQQGEGKWFQVANTEEEAVSLIKEGIDKTRPASSSWRHKLVKEALEQESESNNYSLSS